MQNVSYFSKINTLFKCNQSEIQIVLNTFCLNKQQKNDIIEKNKEKGGAICMGDYNFRFSVIIPVYKVEEYLTETLQSLEKGEKTEIDILNGYFVKMGNDYGVETPVNTKLVQMIHEIEEGKREMTSDNLAEF